MAKHIINNFIALGVHGLILFILWRFPTLLPLEASIKDVIILIVIILIYILCGFFMLPIEEYKFLSTISVMLGVIISIAYVFICWQGIIGNAFAIFNPIAFPIGRLVGVSGSVLISLAIPSLLIYLGMILRARLWPLSNS